jgi:hypothetical protein
MKLSRGRALGYDTDRMIFEFTMLSDKGETVECQISSAAMDEFAGKRGTPLSEREAQFLSFRDAIERIASDNFNRDAIVTVVRHIREAYSRRIAHCIIASMRLGPLAPPGRAARWQRTACHTTQC